MKFDNKKCKTFLTKGLALFLFVNAVCSMLPPLVTEAAKPTVTITDKNLSEYYTYMTDSGYSQDNFKKSKERIVLLSEFVHSLNSDIQEIPSEDQDDYETSLVVWNPTQKQIDDGRDLYFFQWTNGDGYPNPGSGYEILSRIVYLADDGEIRYSKQVTIDDYARDLLDLGLKEQWDNKRVNQFTFAMPDDCAQIIGIFMGNYSDSGDDNDTWWMDNLYIYRITSDKLSDIGAAEKNALNHNQCSFKNGRLAAFVSYFDIAKRYLQTDDEAEEWLYLLQAPDEKTTQVSSGSTYYAQIVTGNSDLSGKDLKLEITYTDITGREQAYAQTINDSAVEKFYPELIFPKEFDDSDNWTKPIYFMRDFRYIMANPEIGNGGMIDHVKLEYAENKNFRDPSIGKIYSNYIAIEIPKEEDAVDEEDVRQQLDYYGNFQNYSWDSSSTTATNLYAFTLFGNYVDYNQMKEDILGPYTSTDIKLDIPNHVQAIKEIKLSLKADAGTAELQDIRIYSSSPDNFLRTRMNGGMSTERVFGNVTNALCLSSLDQSKPIHLNGNAVITCNLNPDANNNRQYQLLQHTNTEISMMAEDDNLGVQISIADIYNAGFEFFMPQLKDKFNILTKYKASVPQGDIYNKLSDIREFMMGYLPEETGWITEATALELCNLMDYYKESLTLNIRYKDEFGSVRQVEIPFITSYLMQIYSDNNGQLGTTTDNLMTGIFQQGDDVGLRVPLSQYSELIDMTLSFGDSPQGVSNLKNNKYYYVDDPNVKYEVSGDLLGITTLSTTYERMWQIMEERFFWNYGGHLNPKQLEEFLGTDETMLDGKRIPNGDTFSIRAIRLYEHVTKKEFSTVYDPTKRVTRLSTSQDCDYYYEAKNKNGTTFAIGSQLKLSLSDDTLKKGIVDYTDADLQNMYLVKLTTQSLYGADAVTGKDLYVTLSYTTTGGEEKKITSQRLSDLGKNFFGGNNMEGITAVTTGYEYQTMEALQAGYGYFLLELEDVSRFDNIHFSLSDGETNGIQINSISIYTVNSLGQRYSSPRGCSYAPMFTREFTGDRVAYNNKPAALQPNKEGITFHFTKVNSDGTIEEPSVDSSHQDEYLTTPPTSMTYEETLKNLGLSITKYTYTVDVNVANILDAGSSNYFYFQLVFENGTSGVVLANQQLASDSFRQGYTESFAINTTQNYGNVTAVRVICDTTSSTSQVFDKLNIDSITVSLPSEGGAKSWIIDNVGWIDINFQDEGVATTISDDGRNSGFPNSQVIKEFARTRTASTARLLFNISTAANSSPGATLASFGNFEGSIVYEDTAGYTQTYNFDLRAAVYNYMENENPYFAFLPNISNYFTVSINDIASVKSLNIYRSNGSQDWIIKDVTISRFSDMGELYKSTTGEFKRYLEDETLVAASTNSNLTITPSGTGTFIFESHSISMDTTTNDPSTWTTTITRFPVTSQETLNVYLYAGSTENRTYTFHPENIPGMKGRLEYTFKNGGSTIGSEAFTFTGSGTINGTTVLKATGIKVTGMNQLKTLHLETSSTASPIISGARVERIRGNTIVETLYFDFANTTMNAGQNYSTIAKADTLSSPTKQMLALQLSSGQEQLFNANSDVAVALLYTSENSSSDTKKALYSSPYVFFTDVGITSLGNTSVLEIPFEISGVDRIVGISIISNGPNVKFENAIGYNYIENANEEKMLIDTCQIAQSFSSSTIEKQLMEEPNVNVTPVTLTFTTSSDVNYQGAGASGRLPLTIHYKSMTGQNETMNIDNFAALLPATTLPTAGSNVSFCVQLSNLSHLTAITLNAPNDDWHLNKISAEISNIANRTIITQQRDAFVDSWITAQAPVTAVFSTGNDAELAINQIVNFSITGQSETSGNVATATSGNALQLQAIPGERVTFTPLVTTSGSLDNSIIWDTSQYGNHMLNGANSGLIFHVPSDSVGQVFSFTAYCSFDPDKTITITIEIVEYVPPTTEDNTASDTNSDTTIDSTEDTSTQEDVSVDTTISINNDGSAQSGPVLPSFSSEEGRNQSYSIFVKAGEQI